MPIFTVVKVQAYGKTSWQVHVEGGAVVCRCDSSLNAQQIAYLLNRNHEVQVSNRTNAPIIAEVK